MYYGKMPYLSTESSYFHLCGTEPNFLCSVVSKCFESLKAE